MATTSSFSPSQDQNIPLRRLPSPTSSRYTSSVLTNPFSDTNALDQDDRSSINHSLLQHPDLALAWRPNATFRINSVGKPFMALPTPVSQLEIPVFRLGNGGGEGDVDGEGGGEGRKAFVSVRPERRSGSCSFFAVGEEERANRELSSTTYVFGPGRPPIVRIYHDASASDPISASPSYDIDEKDEFPVTKSSLWNRTHGFESKRWGRFEWRYAGKAERKVIAKLRGDGREINNLMVLEKSVAPASGKGKKDGKGKGEERKVRVAMLIRGEGTRTQGTRSKDAGNGGILEVCLGGAGGNRGAEGREGEGEEGNKVIDEVMILVTCLVMLKKEVDRARGRRVAIIGAAASG